MSEKEDHEPVSVGIQGDEEDSLTEAESSGKEVEERFPAAESGPFAPSHWR